MIWNKQKMGTKKKCFIESAHFGNARGFCIDSMNNICGIFSIQNVQNVLVVVQTEFYIIQGLVLGISEYDFWYAIQYKMHFLTKQALFGVKDTFWNKMHILDIKLFMIKSTIQYVPRNSALCMVKLSLNDME